MYLCNWLTEQIFLSMKTYTTPLFYKEAYLTPELSVLNWDCYESVLQSSPGNFDNQEDYGGGWD